MTREPDQRACEAVRAVTTAHGLAHATPEVIHSGSNVVVQLTPFPVVARVMTGTVALHDDPERWLTREVSVEAFLAPSKIATKPSPLIAPGPFEWDGLWMTFAEQVVHVAHPSPLAEPARYGRALRALHDALRPFDGDLATLPQLFSDIERLHRRLEPTAETARLRRRLDDVREVFESEQPVQALHGDTSLTNLFRTAAGLVWNDFEDTFRGPVHWDVASFAGSVRARGADPEFIQAMLDAYGSIDASTLEPFSAAQDVYFEIWKTYDRQRRRGRD